jgi:hypothetical protein
MGEFFPVGAEGVACASVVHNIGDVILFQLVQVLMLLFVMYRGAVRDTPPADDDIKDK